MSKTPGVVTDATCTFFSSVSTQAFLTMGGQNHSKQPLSFWYREYLVYHNHERSSRKRLKKEGIRDKADVNK